MPSFPGYALAAMVAAVLLIGLGIISLSYGQRDRVRVTFALFCFSWGLFAAGAARMQVVGSPGWGTMADALEAARILPLLVVLTMYNGLQYVLALTGYHRRLDDRLFFMSLRQYLWLYGFFCLLIVAVSLGTDRILDELRFSPLLGYSVLFKPGAILYQFPLGVLDLMGLTLLFRRLREVGPGAYRAFVRHNLIGIIIIKLAVVVLANILPRFGLPTFLFSFHVYALSAFYFFGVIASYQHRQIRELAHGLELKVAERTEELRQAQARLVQTEKITALGRLVAGVAHEVNTPLGAVRSMHDTRVRAQDKLMGRLETLAPDTDLAGDRKMARARRLINEADQVIGEGLERIQGTMTRLRGFAHLDEADHQRVDLNRELDATLALMAGPLGDGVTVERVRGEIPPVLCDPRQLNQAFVNLMENASAAMGGAGTLRVETSPAGDGQVSITIQDSGCGIPEEDLERIFDPGFTSRGVGVGTGLGLTICFQVVQEHGGEIRVDSEVGKGTRVEITLPVGADKST